MGFQYAAFWVLNIPILIFPHSTNKITSACLLLVTPPSLSSFFSKYLSIIYYYFVHNFYYYSTFYRYFIWEFTSQLPNASYFLVTEKCRKQKTLRSSSSGRNVLCCLLSQVSSNLCFIFLISHPFRSDLAVKQPRSFSFRAMRFLGSG